MLARVNKSVSNLDIFVFFSSLKTKDVITALLKKFHILDHPRKFALYEQELKNNKIGKLSTHFLTK